MTTPHRTAPPETRRDTLRRWLADAELDPRELRDAGYGTEAQGADRRELTLHLRRNYEEVRQLRAQSVNINTTGGYLRPANFEDALEIALLWFDAFRPFATVDRVETGGATHHPMVSDTTQIGTVIPESASISANDITGFGDSVFRPDKFTSGFLKLPNEWVEDTSVNLDLWLARLIGQRIGRAQTQLWTSSVLVPQSTKGATAGSPTALAGDDLLSLEYAVDYSYRQSPSCAWMMSNGIRQIIAQLKDAQGRYLFTPRRTPSKLDMLDGFPVLYNPYLPSTIASGTQSVYFGAWDRIHIRDVRETRIVRLTERFADYDQTATAGLLRSAMNLMDAGSHPIQYLQH